MEKKLKPLTKGERNIISLIAAVMVCAEVEAKAVAPALAKETGKPYDFKSPTSYLNIFLNNNPEYKRVRNLLLKDKANHERVFLEQCRRENGK
ncbi:MAG: hypothetical protein ACTMIX_03425 [Kluyvera intermedia]